MGSSSSKPAGGDKKGQQRQTADSTGQTADRQPQASTKATTQSPATANSSKNGTNVPKTSVRDVKKQTLEAGDHRLLVNCLIENIFLITLNKDVTEEGCPRCCVYLGDRVARMKGQTWLDMGCLEEAVFERLLSDTPGGKVVDRQIQGHGKRDSFVAAGESRCLRYLCQCSDRYHVAASNTKFSSCKAELDRCKEVIYLNTRTCLEQPDLYPTQTVPKQLIDLCLEQANHILDDEGNVVKRYYRGLLDSLHSDKNKQALQDVFLRIFMQLYLNVSKLTLDHQDVLKYIQILKLFSTDPSLAEMLLDFTSPSDLNKGSAYENTLLGSLLGLSCIPKSLKNIQFFKKPLSVPPEELKHTEDTVSKALRTVNKELFQLLFDIIKLSPLLRHKVMTWLGRCLHANEGKPKLWSALEAQVFNPDFGSDGFCLNLCHLTLQLCEPFSKPCSDKLLKVNLTYTKVKAADDTYTMKKNVHARGLGEVPTLAPMEETDAKLKEEESYNFITECFFLTHQAFYTGFSLVRKFNKLNQALGRLHRIFKDVQQQYPPQVISLVKQQLEKELSLFLSIKAALMESSLVEMSLNFSIATATWLNMVARGESAHSFDIVSLPLPEQKPANLTYIPEYILGNVTTTILFLRDFKDEMLARNQDYLTHLMTFILVYMGDPIRLVNPNMRGQLAEALEALLPQTPQDNMGPWGASTSYYKEGLFKEHLLIDHLSEKLFHVFVSIEMTGHSVDSEIKFKFRKSMYTVLEYIWEIPRHKQAIKKLSRQAEADIEATDPPLFLRFINHMINDATFLLDEALDHMKQLKQLELDKASGNWTQLPAEQQQINESNLRQLGMLGQYRNVLANLNIHSLELITRENKAIFCHPIMVDRVAGMLNYFLKQLVGPNRKDYKVKDMQEYDFKPDQIVTDIVHVYNNLGDQENFRQAVVTESRSFSVELFEQAIDVLRRLRKPDDFIQKFLSFSDGIKEMATEQDKIDEMFGDIPEEFQDPIIGTLMKDPVILPTSKKTVDRAIIARHLLSDQFDPFNRQPLTLDMVIPDTELKERISAWIELQKHSPS